MSAVVEAVSDVVSSVGDAVGSVVEAVGDVATSIMDNVVEPVVDTVGKVVESAMEDPLGTIVKIGVAIVAPELLPLVSAADTLAHGGDLGDALKSAATTYVAQGIGGAANSFGDQVGAAAQYGTDIGSSQTAMLAAQDAGMGTIGDVAGNIAGSTAAGVVRGQDPLQALVSGGVSAGTAAVTSQIDGFADLPKNVQAAANAAIATTLKGGDPTGALINAALNAGIGAIKDSSANGIADTSTRANTSSVEAAPPIEPAGLASLPTDTTTPDAAPADTTAPADGLASLDAKAQQDMTPQDWAALYATPSTDPTTGQTAVGGNLADYAPQNFGASANMDWASYEQSLKDMANNNGFSSLWKPNADGTHSYTADDGSTMTVDADGNIVNVTNSTDTKYSPAAGAAAAPSGGLPSLGGAGALALGAGLAAGLANGQGGGINPGAQAPTPMTMDWNQQAVNGLQNGIAYGQQYLDPTFQNAPAAAGGGLMALAHGGATGGQYNLGSYSDGGRLLKGPGDGMSDHIPATIAHKQPARLADGEFVIPADVVSHLGNGSTDAGSRVLYDMMDKVRKARTGSKKQGKQINPNKFVPR